MKRRVRGGRFVGRLLASACCVAAGACGEQRAQRAQPAGDSSANARRSQDPAALFRATRGTTWELARLGTQELPPSRPDDPNRPPGRHPGPGSRPTIRFSADTATGVFASSTAYAAGGWSFCNGYGTSYELGPGDRLRFREFGSTLVGCDGPDSVETRFSRGLYMTRRFEILPDTLMLIAEDGSRLTFVAAKATGKD